MHEFLIANELINMGFKTEVNQDGVLVSLKNRKVSTMEIETVLEQVFEEIQFNVKCIDSKVLVKE